MGATTPSPPGSIGAACCIFSNPSLASPAGNGERHGANFGYMVDNPPPYPDGSPAPPGFDYPGVKQALAIHKAAKQVRHPSDVRHPKDTGQDMSRHSPWAASGSCQNRYPEHFKCDSTPNNPPNSLFSPLISAL
eukprot:1151277-Pelagomonas_calceolata.AAC.2